MHRMLSNRLRLQNYIKRFPHVSEVKIERPIFILGLPRTGSTLLHELMDCHPNPRAPTFWEATFVPDQSAMDRCRQLVTALQALSLRTMQFHAVHDVSDYNAWLETCDWQRVYNMHKRCLQWLQLNGEDQRWVLKAPGHMPRLRR